MKKKLIIWGAGGHALVVSDIIRLRHEYEIVGYLDDVNPHRKNEKFGGSLVLGGQEVLASLRKQGVQYLILGMGDCAARLRLSNVVKSHGFSLATAIHPQAVVASDVKVGAGSVVAALAVLNPGTQIGENVIVNTGASVDHECVIEEGAHIGPGVRLGGKVKIGKGAWVGIGAIVRDSLTIGPHAVIGAGSVVVEDIPEGVLAYGNPARPKEKNKIKI